ncbi:hypothetical protein EES47_07140 [Streptomyces sp. ADI98-12]|nr:hypothetical protein EES47_07140 [Streptomyces sp. ADI98-12]
MGHDHALGTTRGTRGVDHVGAGVERYLGHRRRAGRLRLLVPLPQGARGDDEGGAAVLPDEGEPLLGPLRVHRHVHAAEPGDRQQHGQPLHRPGQGDADPDLRADAHRGQPAGRPLHPRVHLGVRQGLVAADHGGAGGAPRGHAGAPQRAQGDRGLSDAGTGHAPSAQQGLPLAAGDQLHPAQRAPRALADHGGGQLHPVPAQPLHRRPVEQVGAVLHLGAQAARAAPELEGQVEAGRVARDVGPLGGQPGEGGEVGEGVLEDDGGLDEGGAARVALRRQRLHQAVEGHVLVGEGGQRGVADLRQEAGEGAGLVDPGAQHQGVDEEADQVGGLLLVTPGGDGAHREVGPAAPAGQQELGEGGDHHEEAGPLLAPERHQPLGHLGRHVEGVHGPGGGAHGGTRPVGGQLQRLQPRQPLTPVRHLAVQRVPGGGLALPQGVVGVLHGECGEPGVGGAGQRGGVEGAQVADEDAGRPAVGDDVVERGHQDVLGGAETDRQDPQQRPGAQVERGGVLGPQRRVEGGGPLLLAESGEVPLGHGDPRRGGGRAHHLHRAAVLGGEHGPQGLVPGHQRVHRPVQRGGVQLPGDPQRGGGVVLAAVGRELVEDPQALLGGGERHRGAALGARDGGGGGGPGLLRPRVGQGRQVGEDRPLEEGAPGQRHGGGGPQPGDDLEGEDRIAAEVEEVVVRADLPGVQHLGPDPGEDPLGGGPGRGAGPVGAVGVGRAGGGQGEPVELAVGGQRQRVQDHQGRRDHELRQSGGGVGADRPRVQGAAGLRDEVGDQPSGAGPVLPGGDDGTADVRVGGEHRLDLPRLDAQTADLHLVVAAPAVLQGAVGAPADQVTGAVEAVPGAGRVGGETGGGQSGPPVVAAGQRSAEVQLAPGAHRDGAQRLVEHEGAGAGQGGADRVRARRARRQRRAEGGADGGLGRAVGVEDPAPARRPAGHDVVGAALAADDEGPQVGQVALGQGAEDDRRHHQMADAALGEQPQQLLAHRLALGEDEGGAGGERHEDVGHRHVEAGRDVLEHPAAGVQAERVDVGGGETGQARVRDDDALGATGRTGGVDHVRRVVRGGRG